MNLRTLMLSLISVAMVSQNGFAAQGGQPAVPVLPAPAPVVAEQPAAPTAGVHPEARTGNMFDDLLERITSLFSDAKEKTLDTWEAYPQLQFPAAIVLGICLHYAFQKICKKLEGKPMPVSSAERARKLREQRRLAQLRRGR